MEKKSQAITPGFIFEMILKWHWLLIIPFCISVIAGIVIVKISPRLYQAETLILVQPQKVPETIVKDIIASGASDRISTLSQRILSRTNIETIITKFSLFSDKDSKKLFMEEKVAHIRALIKVKVNRSRNKTIDSFTISFRWKNPQVVRNVANYLATSFIDENLKLREVQVLGTSAFLEDELSSMRKKLILHEKGLKNYREKYMGGLPEQLNSNLSILDNLNDQLANVMSGIANAQERIASVETLYADLAKVTGTGEKFEKKPETREEMMAQLEIYRKRYTEWHPDVIRLKKMIEQEDQKKAEKVENEEGDTEPAGVNKNLSAEAIRQTTMLQNEIKQLMTEKKELTRQIAVYKKRVEDTPKREQELMSLQRDYENIKSTYDSLLARKLEAQIAVNMEKKQKGEQFRVLDAARLPQKPVSPDLRMLFLLFSAAGLGVGAGLIFLIEFLLNDGFRQPDEVQDYLGLPVIATIPKVELPREILMGKVKALLGIVGVVVSMLLFSGFVVLITSGGGFG